MKRYTHPHYRRRYYRGNNSIEKVIGVLFLLSFLLYISGGASKFFSTIFPYIVFVGIILLIIGITKRIIIGRKALPAVVQNNSEKHGCRCYMDGLSNAEQKVVDLLSQGLDYKNYFIFNNLIIPSENNGSTQIDHLIVSRFGIFVLESKDYNGWIFGSENQPSWTQSLPGRNKFQFQNPIRQNYAHIMALKTLMPFLNDYFHGIIVFSEKAEIKTSRIEGVVYLRELIEYIKKYTQEKVSENGMHLAIGKLSYVCQTVDITSGDHVANLRNAHKPANI